jgi:regulator of sigma E protease
MTVILVIIILGVLVFVHELGHFLMAKWTNTRVDEFAIGFKPTLFSKKYGETTYMVNVIPFGGYVKIPGEDPVDIKEQADPRSMHNKSRWQKAVILFGGILFNVIFAWILIVGIFTAGIPVGSDTAEKYQDHIVEVADGAYALHAPLHVAIKEGTKLTGVLTYDVMSSFGSLVGGIFTGNSSVDELTGPVGLGEVVGQARSFGMVHVIFLTAFISLNLAVLNLFPFPALDGGRLLVLLIESVTRKNVPSNIIRWVNGIGFLLLIVLMIVVTISDISRLIG